MKQLEVQLNTLKQACVFMRGVLKHEPSVYDRTRWFSSELKALRT